MRLFIVLLLSFFAFNSCVKENNIICGCTMPDFEPYVLGISFVNNEGENINDLLDSVYYVVPSVHLKPVEFLIMSDSLALVNLRGSELYSNNVKSIKFHSMNSEWKDFYVSFDLEETRLYNNKTMGYTMTNLIWNDSIPLDTFMANDMVGVGIRVNLEDIKSSE